jgi:hypothetical protein
MMRRLNITLIFCLAILATDGVIAEQQGRRAMWKDVGKFLFVVGNEVIHLHKPLVSPIGFAFRSN